MAVSYSQALQNSRMDAVIAAFDAHASPATLEICTAAYAAVLVAIPLADPSFARSGTKPNTLITMQGVPKSRQRIGHGHGGCGARQGRRRHHDRRRSDGWHECR